LYFAHPPYELRVLRKRLTPFEAFIAELSGGTTLHRYILKRRSGIHNGRAATLPSIYEDRPQLSVNRLAKIRIDSRFIKLIDRSRSAAVALVALLRSLIDKVWRTFVVIVPGIMGSVLSLGERSDLAGHPNPPT